MAGKAITVSEEKSILLDMLIEIDAYCKKYCINYFLIGGTLLGAVRHKGFIPWDDDIDIGMPRDDYERFVATFSSISGNLKVIDHRNYPHYIWPAAKVIDTRTELIENGHTKNRIGVFIDIFPLDCVAGDYAQAVIKQKKVQKWHNMLTLRSLSWKSERPVLKNVIITLSKVLEVIPSKVIIEHIRKLSSRDNGAECRYICNFSGAWGIREIADIKYFEAAVKQPFEGYDFCIPSGYHDYLTTVYGDYMVMPPEEKRVTHHGNVSYWKEDMQKA